jgi:hypothetical protein
MKFNIIFTGILTLFLLAMVSCEKLVTNVALPDVKPRVVVFSYLNPGADSIVAEVFYSSPINQPGSYWKNTIKDAEVILTETGGNSVAFQYHQPTENYIAAIDTTFLKAGSSYSLKVLTAKGEKAEAISELPPKNQTLRIATFDSTIIEDLVRYRFKLEFDDPVGKPDHYRLIAKAVVRRVWEGDTSVWEYGVGFNYGDDLIAVKDNDGQTFAAEGILEIFRNEFWIEDQLIGLKCYLLATDEHYYHFHRSLQNYEPDNPFSEPTIIYSNINGGLGVLAGFNPFKVEFMLEDFDAGPKIERDCYYHGSISAKQFINR